MSGQQKNRSRRQHFLPRLLLKGFAHRKTGKEYYVYEFRKGTEPHEANIKNVAVSGNFYGSSEETRAEEILSARENKYELILTSLRSGHVDPNDKPLIDEFITHLCVRSKFIRDALADMGHNALDSIEQEYTQPKIPPGFRTLIKENILKDNYFKTLPRHQRRLINSKLDRIIDAFLKTGKTKEAFHFLRDRIGLENAIKRSQAEALEKLNAPPQQKVMLSPLPWSIKEYPSGTFVLGDLGPLAIFTGSQTLQPPIRGGSNLEALFLPISSDLLLVGNMKMGIDKFDPEALNIASVELSRDFFIASRNTDRERKYFSILGKRSSLITKEDMEQRVSSP